MKNGEKSKMEKSTFTGGCFWCMESHNGLTGCAICGNVTEVKQVVGDKLICCGKPMEKI